MDYQQDGIARKTQTALVHGLDLDSRGGRDEKYREV